MIREIVERWEKNKGKLRAHITKEGKSYEGKEYEGLLKDIINIVLNDDESEFHERDYDAERVTIIDDGDYQGTLIFVFPYDTYQPMASDYLYTSVGYGSCSVCDTWESAVMGDNFVDDMMTLALHMIQSMKRMEDSDELDEVYRKAEAFDEIEDYLSRPSPIDEDRDEIQKIIDEYDERWD